MANPIFHSQYTAAQIEDLIENGAPIIQNGYWWRWDVATQQYVNTNITADSETAAQAAEAAQAAAEDARDDAQDAQTAAETAQGLAEDARDAAAASAASIAASAAQIDANTERIDYVALREEEDRQILFGSVVEAATDEYSELRSAPIHNAITIGGSVYPRMDRTRMAIDAIRGRTVAFNQLYPTHAGYSVTSGSATGLSVSVSDGYIDITGTAQSDAVIVVTPGNSIPAYHVCFMMCDGWNGFAWGRNGFGFVTNKYWMNYHGNAFQGTAAIKIVGGETYNIHARFCTFDLTAEYGTTLADSIYAMEQAAAGAGVAYVRQRMDLDYYAANGGELVAPVVSEVGFTGKNLFDLNWWVVQYPGQCSISSGVLSVSAHGELYSKGIAVDIPLDNGAYISVDIKNGTSANARIRIIFENGTSYVVGQGSTTQWGTYALAIPAELQLKKIVKVTFDWSTAGVFEVRNLLIALGSSATAYTPYLSTTLSIPSTRLDGVGTAQDVMYVREDGENDYSIVKTAKMALVDLGTLTYTDYGGGVFRSSDISGLSSSGDNYELLSPMFVVDMQLLTNKQNGTMVKSSSSAQVYFVYTAAASAAAMKTAMNGVMLAYELATPTETVISEHLTLAEISAIAENGGIISVENSNGHIVQPDMVCDVVISRSAS